MSNLHAFWLHGDAHDIAARHSCRLPTLESHCGSEAFLPTLRRRIDVVGTGRPAPVPRASQLALLVFLICEITVTLARFPAGAGVNERVCRCGQVKPADAAVIPESPLGIMFPLGLSMKCHVGDARRQGVFRVVFRRVALSMGGMRKPCCAAPCAHLLDCRVPVQRALDERIAIVVRHGAGCLRPQVSVVEKSHTPPLQHPMRTPYPWHLRLPPPCWMRSMHPMLRMSPPPERRAVGLNLRNINCQDEPSLRIRLPLSQKTYAQARQRRCSWMTDRGRSRPGVLCRGRPVAAPPPANGDGRHVPARIPEANQQCRLAVRPPAQSSGQQPPTGSFTDRAMFASTVSSPADRPSRASFRPPPLAVVKRTKRLRLAGQSKIELLIGIAHGVVLRQRPCSVNEELRWRSHAKHQGHALGYAIHIRLHLRRGKGSDQ